ncbi:MBL fold metallo-hydrolase [Fundicoccus culcitae]|uniref:MBL fold metallo-hydrolase n=1 Tax=Fundicoccus culcitae TaxID=2969821 RepID=A0ABY5P5F9_9LACT|nr:MBL fold metallo-hydrolase [Fundicoccus culcitae]UUX33710.1 MBL fold metallo-hydrolase [Fundicoccus culcitae]
MKIYCIGCAGGYPMDGHGTTSFVVTDTAGEYHLLMDAGSGSALNIEKYIDVSELDAIWLSHDHPDHAADIGIYQHLLKLKKPAPKKIPVPIYVHPNSVYADWLVEDKESKPVVYQPDTHLDLGPFRARFIRTTHPVECYAIRLTERETGKAFVFTADSGWQDSMVEFAHDADLLIADTNFSNELGRNAIHMTAEEVATLANKANAKKLVASHIPPQAETGLILGQVTEALNDSIEFYACRPTEVYEI